MLAMRFVPASSRSASALRFCVEYRTFFVSAAGDNDKEDGSAKDVAVPEFRFAKDGTLALIHFDHDVFYVYQSKSLIRLLVLKSGLEGLRDERRQLAEFIDERGK